VCLVSIFQETDIEGLKASAKIVYKHIDGEVRAGIPSNKIIIGGFSQGMGGETLI
jgi:predicted esterase